MDTMFFSVLVISGPRPQVSPSGATVYFPPNQALDQEHCPCAVSLRILQTRPLFFRHSALRSTRYNIVCLHPVSIPSTIRNFFEHLTEFPRWKRDRIMISIRDISYGDRATGVLKSSRPAFMIFRVPTPTHLCPLTPPPRIRPRCPEVLLCSERPIRLGLRLR